MFQAELAAQAAQTALKDIVPVLLKIVKDEQQKAEDRLHAVHVLISIAQLGE